MFSVKHKGDFSNLEKLINTALRRDYLNILNEYGKKGVDALKSATPADTGKTRDSWSYIITSDSKKTSICWTNDNLPNSVPVALILQYGHATRNGGFVQGIDYINPALKPIFDKMADEAWGRLTK